MSDKKTSMLRQNATGGNSVEFPRKAANVIGANAPDTIGVGVNGLLPCPFCGGEAYHTDDTGENDDVIRPAVQCCKCTARTKTAEEWNQRAPWLPISTAPKDAEILVLHDTAAVDIAYWDTKENRWRSTIPGDDSGCERLEPSHWFPIPDRKGFFKSK